MARLPPEPPPMIPARKRPAFNFLLRRWLTRTLRRRFHNVYLAGRDHLEALDAARPVVGCVNHTNWWDGFVLYVLSHRRLPHDIYLAMEESNLRRYRFFTWMGVFGIDLSNRRASLPGLRYALGLLRDKNARPPKLVWMFVQGKLRPPAVPVEGKPGASFLASRADAALLPLVLRYEWLGESRPSIFIRVGAAMPSDAAPEKLARTLNDLLAATDGALGQGKLDEYEPWFAPAMSMNKRWDHCVHRCLRRGKVFDKQNTFPR